MLTQLTYQENLPTFFRTLSAEAIKEDQVAVNLSSNNDLPAVLSNLAMLVNEAAFSLQPAVLELSAVALTSWYEFPG